MQAFFHFFSLGGPAPCGRRRAFRFTRFARAHSNPCRDGTSGRCRHIPICHGEGIHPDARRASLPIPAVLTDCRRRGHHHRKSSPHRAPRQGAGTGRIGMPEFHHRTPSGVRGKDSAVPPASLLLYHLHFNIFGRESVIGSLFGRDDTVSNFSFDVLSGDFSCVTATLCHLLVFGHRLGIAVA